MMRGWMLACVVFFGRGVTVAGALRGPASSKLWRSDKAKLKKAAQLQPPASLAAVANGGEEKSIFIKYRTVLLFGALVAQKVAADSLTGWTRSRTVYSGATVSMLSEIAKFPVLALAICVFGGGWRRIGPTVKGAVTQSPLKISWIAGAYAAQNVLYFAALSYISAASYQVLSQSKLIFTAFLTTTMLGRVLTGRQIGSLAALLVGSVLVQVSEMSGLGSLAGGNAALYGGFLTVLGALLSALPNVWYEKLLKTEGEDEWVRNVQVTCWIFAWIAAGQVWHAIASQQRPFASIASFTTALLGGEAGFEGITPAVWLIVALKAMNGILVPATLKYAGNLVYLYAKPTSIVATALIAAVYVGALPPASFVLGSTLVIGSMITFSTKKKQ